MPLLRPLCPLVHALRTPPRMRPVLGPALQCRYSSWQGQRIAKWKSFEEIDAARNWVYMFTMESIPRGLCDVTYARSSGPGGQNVNKLSTKATLHLDLSKANFLPEYVVRKVRENSRHLTKDGTILVQCDTHRKQSENTEECFERLYTILRAAVEQDVPGETSQSQKDRVAQLKKEEREQRKTLKNMQKSKKESRRSRGDDD